MVFRISRLRVVAAEDAGFSDLVSVLPDGNSPFDVVGSNGRLPRRRLTGSTQAERVWAFPHLWGCRRRLHKI
jgi:hypothetical protein